MILDLIFFADKSFSRKLLVTYVKNLRGRPRRPERPRGAVDLDRAARYRAKTDRAAGYGVVQVLRKQKITIFRL